MQASGAVQFILSNLILQLEVTICIFFSHGAMFLPELRPDEVFSQMPWVLTMSGCFFLARRLADLSFLCVDGSGESWVRVKVDS